MINIPFFNTYLTSFDLLSMDEMNSNEAYMHRKANNAILKHKVLY